MHTAPAAAGSIGWVCTAAGTPGTEGLDAINAKLAEWLLSVVWPSSARLSSGVLLGIYIWGMANNVRVICNPGKVWTRRLE